jgi:hypothetical protein
MKRLLSKYKLYVPILLLLALMALFKLVIGPPAATYFVLSSEILVLYVFFVIFYKRRNSTRKMMRIQLSTELIPAFRVIYVVLCLYSFFQNITLIDSQLEPSSFYRLGMEFSNFNAYLFNGIYFLSLIAILLGYRVRLAFVVLFLTGGLIIPFSLEIFVKNIINFYAIFIPTYAWYGKKAKSDQFDGWPIFLMVLSLSFLMSVAGVCKLFDPLWQENLGLYYTLNISYFTPKYLWFLLDYPNLLAVINWITIFVEVVCLPLFFFKQTRILALYCLVFLGLFLSFIMAGIGVVGGPIVLAGCILALAITKIPEKLNKFLPKIQIPIFKSEKTAGLSRFENRYVSLFIYVITMTQIIFYSIDIFLYNLNFTKAPLYGNYVNNSPKIIPETSPIYKGLKTVSESLKITEVHIHWRFIWSLHLFDYDHLCERRIFRVVFEDEQGNTFEPRHYFNEDGTTHEDYPLPSNERFYFLVFRINEAINKDGFDESRASVQTLIHEMNTIIKYSNKDKRTYKTAKILMKNLYQPYEYQEEHKPWIKEDWFTFYTYQPDLDKGTITDSMEIYDYSKLKVKVFQDKVITPNF